MNKQLQIRRAIPNPDYDPAGKDPRPNVWDYQPANRDVQVGDVVGFLCNGRGRGGHYRVHAKVTKVNAKTFKATELPRSYAPGTLWTVHRENTSGLFIDLSWKE